MGFGSFGGRQDRAVRYEIEDLFNAYQIPGFDVFSGPAEGYDTFTSAMIPASSVDGEAQSLYFGKSLLIPSGITVTPTNRCKGLFIYVNGSLKIVGSISMTARGATGEGIDTPLINVIPTRRKKLITRNDTTISIEEQFSRFVGGVGHVPAVGADPGAGAASVSTGGANNGLPGFAGTLRKSGGGGGGGTRFYNVPESGTGGSGSAGTAFSGGSGGGGSAEVRSSFTTPALKPAGGDGAPFGGPGGNGAGYVYSAGNGACGGAGNPGGTPSDQGTNGGTGTGGLIWIVVRGDLIIVSGGVISANGSAGGSSSNTNSAGGGGSGGGSINIAYGRSFNNAGTIVANGGAGGTASTAASFGGAGGAGCITIEHIAGLLA